MSPEEERLVAEAVATARAAGVSESDVQRVLAEEFEPLDNLSPIIAEMRLHGLAKACRVG